MYTLMGSFLPEYSLNHGRGVELDPQVKVQTDHLADAINWLACFWTISWCHLKAAWCSVHYKNDTSASGNQSVTPYSLDSSLYFPGPSKLQDSSSMEEVWKDITTLSSSSSSAYHSYLPTTAGTHHQSSVHDFLASPMCPTTQRCAPKNVPDHGFASSVFPPQCSLKRDSEDDNGCCDRRYKRKMKNRESATRSRARRQAYTNELEVELARLREENAMLKRQQEEMSSAAAAAATVAQVPKKSTLLRSHSAPF